MLLGRKLISILLFGSSVLTLVGNSNVYANEDGAVKALEAAQEGEKLVGRDDNNKTNPEALTSVENSDVRADENEIVEEGKKLVDSNIGTNSEDNEDIDTDDEPEGFSFDSSAVKSLGAAALGAGLVVGTDRVINSFRGSSKSEVKPEQRKTESVYDTKEYKNLQNELNKSWEESNELERKNADLASEGVRLRQDLEDVRKELQDANVKKKETEGELNKLRDEVKQQKKLDKSAVAWGTMLSALSYFGLVAQVPVIREWLKERGIDVDNNPARVIAVISTIIGFAYAIYKSYKYFNSKDKFEFDSCRKVARYAVELVLPQVGMGIDAFAAGPVQKAEAADSSFGANPETKEEGEGANSSQ